MATPAGYNVVPLADQVVVQVLASGGVLLNRQTFEAAALPDSDTDGDWNLLESEDGTTRPVSRTCHNC